MDETSGNPTAKGGIITYIRADLGSKIRVYAATPRYIISVIDEKLVNINCYLPQPQLYQTGEYKQCLMELREIIYSLGESYAFIITGDMNSGTLNRRHFQNFVRELQLDDWSDCVPYSYTQNSRYGLVKSKIDYLVL